MKLPLFLRVCCGLALLCLGASPVPQSVYSAWRIQLSQIDDSAYPVVSAFVRVLDEHNNPVTGLGAEDFAAHVFSNTLLASPALPLTVTAQTETSGALTWVLVVDEALIKSKEPNALINTIKTATRNFVSRLPPHDLVAVVTTHDTVSVTQALTQSRPAVMAAIESLTVTMTATRTHLNAATLQAISLTQMTTDAREDAQTEPQKNASVIVLVTDTGDTATGSLGSIAAAQVVSAAQAAGVRLLTIGLGRMLDAPAYGKNTVGQLTLVRDTSEFYAILNRLTNDASRWRQGYRISFVANKRAYGQIYLFDLKLRAQQSAIAQGAFVARPHPFSATLAELEASPLLPARPVLTPQGTNMVVPIESVTYFADGSPLGRVNQAPFALSWVSPTAAAGPHVISATVMDGVGNITHTRAYSAEVLALPVLRLSTVNPTHKSNVMLPISVQSVARLRQVDVLLDGTTIVSKTAAPFEFMLSPAGWGLGEHRLTVRAFDVLGQQSETTQPVQIVSPPATFRLSPVHEAWLMAYGPWVGALLGLVLLYGLLVRARRVVLPFDLENAGNLATAFALHALDERAAMNYHFEINGGRLSPQRLNAEGHAQTTPTSPAQRWAVTPQLEAGAAQRLVLVAQPRTLLHAKPKDVQVISFALAQPGWPETLTQVHLAGRTQVEG